MSIVQRIAKNVAVLYVARIVTSLLVLVLYIYIARILGDVTLGKYSFAVAFTTIFAVFLDLGFDTLLVRDIARDKSLAPKYLGNITIIKAILSIVIFGLIALIINLMHYPSDTTTAVLIFGVYIIFTAFANTFRVTFRAFERMEYEALVVIICRLITASLGLATLFLGYGLIELACVFLIGGIFDILLSFFFCDRKFTRPKFDIDLDFWKRATKVAFPIGFLSISAIIYTRIDTIMLSATKGDAVVGWYNAAYNLILSLQPFPFIFTTTLLPVVSSFFISSPNLLNITYEKSLRYMFILGLPLAAGIMLLSERVILLFYGAEFFHSIIALQILAWEILLYFLHMLLSTIMVSIDKQNQVAVAVGTSALLNVILNLILIPHFSYVGAGIATIATETILFGLYFSFASKYLCRLPLHKIVVKPIIACATMAVFVHFSSGLNLAAVIIVAVVIYFSVFILIKGFTKEDRELLAKVISRRRAIIS